MNNKKVNVGIIGTGFIADLHIDALNRVANTNVVGCCDVNIGRAKSFAKRWNIKSYYNDLDQMSVSEKIDVAHVLVPPNFHYPVSVALMEKGINLFLEKPMGLNSSECEELLQIGEKNNIKIGINHNYLFYPLFLKLKKDLAENKIGKPEYISIFYGGPLGQLDFKQYGNWMFNKPGNIILEQGPHPISQVCDILGKIKEIKATVSGKRELGRNQFFHDRWQGIVECEHGNAFLHLSFGKNYSNQRNLHVFGRDGSIYIDFLNNRYLVQKKSFFPDYLDPTANALRFLSPALEGLKDFSDYAMSKVNLKDRSDSFFMTMNNSVAAFYDAFSSNQKLPCTGYDGFKAIKACEQWIVSAKVEDNPSDTYELLESQEDDEILITGATGFIGRCLVDQLIKKGKKVRILVRNINGLPHALYSKNVRIFQGDITDKESINEAVKGVKIVYHLAHSLGKTWDEFVHFNIEPARNFAQACLSEKIKYVYASTIAVYYYGDIANGVVKYDTQIDTKPELRNLYARSKIVAENMLLKMHNEQGLSVMIARPGIVVGEDGIIEHSGVGLWTRDNVCAYWGNGKNKLPFILVEDTAAALVNMIEEKGLEGKCFNLVGDVRLTAREYVEALKKYSKRNITAFSYPNKLMYLSDALKIIIKKIGHDKNTFLSYRDLANRKVNAKFDTQFEKQALSWTSCSTRNVFIKKAFEWAFNG